MFTRLGKDFPQKQLFYSREIVQGFIEMTCLKNKTFTTILKHILMMI